jgi:branched-chain amino acid transport system ATP-binding protein
VLLCEQNLRFCEAIADRAYIIEKGQIRFGGTWPSSPRRFPREQYLSV